MPATTTSSTRGEFDVNSSSDLKGFRVVKDVAPEDIE